MSCAVECEKNRQTACTNVGSWPGIQQLKRICVSLPFITDKNGKIFTCWWYERTYESGNKWSRCFPSSPLLTSFSLSFFFSSPQSSSHSSPLQVSPPLTTARPIKKWFLKGGQLFSCKTYMAPACLHTWLSLWYPTVRCPANHSPQPLTLLPASLLLLSIWLSALMRARLHNMAVSGPMVSRETQDNGWIIKGSPVERKDFFDIFSTTHTTYAPSLFLHPPSFSPSEGPRLPHANERHRCGFNDNQYCANIHLRRWPHGERCERRRAAQGHHLPKCKGALFFFFFLLSFVMKMSMRLHTVHCAHHPSALENQAETKWRRGWK